jgi:hypothetical protein
MTKSVESATRSTELASAVQSRSVVVPLDYPKRLGALVRFPACVAGCGHGSVGKGHSLHFIACGFEATITQRQRRQHEQIKRHRCQQAAENDDSHRSLDLPTGVVAANRER